MRNVYHTHENDLRNVMCAQSRDACDLYRIEYATRFGERRVIDQLTYSDAIERARIMRARAYNVRVVRMFVI